MFYVNYLSGLCQRRRWPDPLYSCFSFPEGFACTVRVNGTDYHVPASPENKTHDIAKEAAAQHAYYITRDISKVERLEREALNYSPLGQQAVAGGSYMARP